MNDIASAERAVLASLLEANGDSLPLPLAQLLTHSPECWDDLRHGQIAVAIRELKLARQAVHALAIVERVQFDAPAAYLAEISSLALPEGIAALEADTIWKRYQVRRTRTLFSESGEQLDRNPALAPSIISNVRVCLDSLTRESHKNGLPDMIDASAFLAQDLPEPRQVIHGVLHRGSKMMIGGGSKSFKTWNLVNLAVSVQSGQPWLQFDTDPGRVLFCNFEMHPFCWQRRIAAVAQARNIALHPGQLVLWNLRGYAADYESLLPKISTACSAQLFDLIIIDPIYKLYGHAKENAAEDMALLLNTIDNLIEKCGAAVAFGSHFSKGNQAAKEAIDRFSGSGVFARDPDSLITMTRHEEDDAFTLEFSLREFAPVNPFVVRWQYPLFHSDDALNPADLKKRPGRPKTSSADDILALLDRSPMTSKDWQKASFDELGISRGLFYQLKDQLSRNDSIMKSKINDCWTRVSKR